MQWIKVSDLFLQENLITALQNLQKHQEKNIDLHYS